LRELERSKRAHTSCDPLDQACIVGSTASQ
jgi:hypothetical protein